MNEQKTVYCFEQGKKIEGIKIFVIEMKREQGSLVEVLLVTKLPCSKYNIPSKGECYISDTNCDCYSPKKVTSHRPGQMLLQILKMDRICPPV
ncbi:hypothetical protein UP17_25740 (plasmid) [Peribacillus simplex]|nr:hypothetical protein UP17_25740 [Peribacillus simplex]